MSKWTPEMDESLLRLIKNNHNNESLVLNMKKSIHSINCRIGYLSYQMYKQKVSIEEIRNNTKLSEKHINYYIEAYKKKEKIDVTTQEYNDEGNGLFSKSQQTAYDCYKRGENIFITGPGGTGKSYFIKKVYEDALKEQKNICVTAMTGCAALLLNCNAKTIHSWGNLGLGNEDEEKIIQRIIKFRKRDNWIKTDILIVDEVSMLSGELFDTINSIAKNFRKNASPFGGIQLIFCGDFHQLPPVSNDSTFCFESLEWNNVFEKEILLKKNFRQINDNTYQKILSEIRNSTITKHSESLLNQCCNKEKPDNIEPTILFPIKRCADEINITENNKLTTKENVYKMVYKKPINKNIEDEINKQKKSLLCDESITLKIGSQVMCIVNLDQDNGVINGSQGKIIGFDTETNDPIIKFFYKNIVRTITKHTWINDKYKDYSISQIPLILSWAITIHKSQGITLEYANIDIGSNIFECGQSYVALSRVKSLEGLYIRNFNVSKIKSNKKVIEYYKKFN